MRKLFVMQPQDSGRYYLCVLGITVGAAGLASIYALPVMGGDAVSVWPFLPLSILSLVVGIVSHPVTAISVAQFYLFFGGVFASGVGGMFLIALLLTGQQVPRRPWWWLVAGVSCLILAWLLNKWEQHILFGNGRRVKQLRIHFNR